MFKLDEKWIYISPNYLPLKLIEQFFIMFIILNEPK